MPYKAPTHKPLGWQAPKPWHGAGRGSTRRWRKLRAAYLAEYPICQHAGCTHAATDLDHIVPVSQGGTDDVDNVQALCHLHHVEKTNKERRQ